MCVCVAVCMCTYTKRKKDAVDAGAFPQWVNKHGAADRKEEIFRQSFATLEASEEEPQMECGVEGLEGK